MNTTATVLTYTWQAGDSLPRVAASFFPRQQHYADVYVFIAAIRTQNYPAVIDWLSVPALTRITIPLQG